MRRPDGRTEPFEPERIARSLFDAAEHLGRADAFLARELTDGVLHFLTADAVGAITTPDQIAEIVAKVVRELGQPALANAYEGYCGVSATTVDAGGSNHVRPPPVPNLFPRDLISAHEEGLIRLGGLANPMELAGVSAALPPGGVADAIRKSRAVAGEFLSIDGPEFDLALVPGEPGQLAEDFLDEARSAAKSLHLILNLNVSSPPARLVESSGPLFHSSAVGRSARSQAIALELARRAPAAVRVWWHLTAEDARREEGVAVQLVRPSTEFVFDRARAPVVLGPGIDRETPAALIEVGVNLARLVEMTGGAPVVPDVFLKKVGSLARFAKTAAHVKQDFMRQHGRPAVREAFLLDRARLVLVPLGLAEAARSVQEATPTEFAREILRTLRTAAERDRPRVLPVRIDSPLTNGSWASVADPDASVRQQVKQGSQLHAVCGAGRLDLTTAAVEDRAEVIRLAAESSVVRLRFLTN